MYKSLKTRLPNFLRYVNKVYSFCETIKSMRDKRARPKEYKLVSGEKGYTNLCLCFQAHEVIQIVSTDYEDDCRGDVCQLYLFQLE